MSLTLGPKCRLSRTDGRTGCCLLGEEQASEPRAKERGGEKKSAGWCMRAYVCAYICTCIHICACVYICVHVCARAVLSLFPTLISSGRAVCNQLIHWPRSPTVLHGWRFQPVTVGCPCPSSHLTSLCLSALWVQSSGPSSEGEPGPAPLHMVLPGRPGVPVPA